ncbi:hypothetical protein SAMN05421640_3214 [Ekhidna lutea]|uniref:Uncharacterized protein n=1 Tax=Ekhidna lutea TaxID=447679 RepID=A0A239LEA5_EKHLU|nr:hypothetical protein [Ekhidna lutea]SNT28967.1 hypothetical protein SAMN05421640_3214 [Ekhidna lutea]
MSKSLKTIIIVALAVGVVILLVFKGESVGEYIGQIFAVLAGGFAAFKAKLFNSSKINVEEEIEAIETEHATKRQNWELIREEYDSKFRAIKARMDYLDYKSATISKQLGNLDAAEKEALKKNTDLSDDELLDWLRN